MAFELPEGAFEVEYDEPDDLADGEVPEDPATAAAREAQQALLLSQELRRPIDRAVTMATITAWTLAVFAVISLPGVFSSFTGFFIVAGLGACSYFEFGGRNTLRDMNPQGASMLARNQLVLGAVIVVYAGANLFMWKYHTRRRPLVEAFVADTPGWIQEPADASGGPSKVQAA